MRSYSQRLMAGELPWQQEIAIWEAQNIDERGCYAGQDLSRFNPRFEVGHPVSATELYSTMLAHRQALRCLEMSQHSCDCN